MGRIVSSLWSCKYQEFLVFDFKQKKCSSTVLCYKVVCWFNSRMQALNLRMMSPSYPLMLHCLSSFCFLWIKLINNRWAWGRCLWGWWNQELHPSAVGNHDNPVSGIHPGTVTLLISGKLAYLTYSSWRAGRVRELQLCERVQCEATWTKWPDLKRKAVNSRQPLRSYAATPNNSNGNC